ncbi:hypothetical protein PC128_g21067 [Phytophthora cactorum]|nr:hypothetical protein PC128_g21067 [Phytophthora cactorum]
MLSEYEPLTVVALQDLSSFDADTLETLNGLQQILFAACYQLATENFNINRKDLEVLTACVVRHYPVLKDLNPESPAVKRLESCATQAGGSLTDLLAWSKHLEEASNACKDNNKQPLHQASTNRRAGT